MIRVWHGAWALVLTTAACSGDTSSTQTSGGQGANGATSASQQASSSTGVTGSGGATTTTSSTGAGGSGGSTPSIPGPDVPVRFVAMGDGGEGNMRQFQVATVIENVCNAHGGCDFALYLGDNIYDSGVDSAMDEQFQTKFEPELSVLRHPRKSRLRRQRRRLRVLQRAAPGGLFDVLHQVDPPRFLLHLQHRR